MKLVNLGCGDAKVTGYINVDINKDCNPDIVANIYERLPWEDGEIDQLIMLHTIEHIPERYQFPLLYEINRVVKQGGEVIFSYPEFKKVAQYYIDNHQGKKEFWKHTIYGRQCDIWDTHFTLMDSDEFREVLNMFGFYDITWKPEIPEEFNTVLRCRNGVVCNTHEDMINNEFFKKAWGLETVTV